MLERIINEINKMSGCYSGYEIFSDWVKAAAISISNSADQVRGDVWKKRKALYMEIAKRHGAEHMKIFSDMLGMLTLALEDNMEDVLGKIYMKAGFGSRQTGQFFTPFHLSYLMAQTTIPEEFGEEKPFTINEPSSGGGGAVIAAAKVLKDRGINFQKCMDVVAQDLDWKGVYMTYTQLSLLGIKAVVVQGDTLKEPYIPGCTPEERIMYTPAKIFGTGG